MAVSKQTESIIVVGLNRARLIKILSLVEENESRTIVGRDISENGNRDEITIEYVPCIAVMSSYEAEDGSQVRFMANFVYQDGSPMKRYFDDEDFRSSLGTVLMVGYEWHPADAKQIEGYFKANNLSVSVQCVSLNPCFSDLDDEMTAFKLLSEDEKDRHLSDQTMGPGKMARFILDSARSIRDTVPGCLGRDDGGELGGEVSKDDAVLAKEESTTAASNESELQPQVEPPDPDLPMFACRICRTILIGENHLAEDHRPNLHSFKRYQSNSRGQQHTVCQSLFCDERVLGWLSPHGKDVEGKLACPKCSVKLGHWNWAGAQCSCGTWIVPAIQIPISKVDTILPATSATMVVMAPIASPAAL